MKKYIKQIKSQLLKTISEIDEYKWMFCRNPETDFTRNRKWSFEDAMLSILHMGCESTGRELLRYFDFGRKKDIPTVSSFVQRKNQILPEAFQFLFHQVTESVYRPKIYKGFRLLACDGFDINIPHNPNDRTTYFQSIPGTKGFNQMHLNALYDLFGGFYQDAVIQPARSENEYLAACKIILHLQKSNILFTNYNERKKKIMEYKKENGTLILGSVEEMRMFANGHITINHDNVKHLVYNGTSLPLGYRCALEFIMLDLNNLKDITIKNDQNFKSVDGIIYSQDGEKLIFCPNGTTGKIVIPDGVKTISKNAFMLCKISEVVIPNSVEIIGDSAFGQCEYLKQVFFSPDSKLKEIKSDAFFGCKMLSEITLPDNLSTMRYSVFRGSGLKHFTFPKYIENIGNNIFESCAIKKINVPKELYVNHCYLDILKSCCTNQCDKVDTTNAFIFHMEEVKPIVIPKCVDKAGVSPEKIGCFTFTNAGAGEMRDRIKGFCSIAGIDVDFDKITISTIHSFGDSLLKQYYNLLGYKKPPVLINEIQRTKIIEEILSKNSTIEELADKYKNFYLDMFRAKGILELMKGYFSDIMDGISQEDFQAKTHLEDETVEAIYRMYMQYDKYKSEACLIEHSDQELGVLRLLRLKPDLFDEVGIEHISVDEYQDTSNIQFKIINEMRKAKCVKSLFIVGDDDQSIYGFREANVELIKDFFAMIGDKNGTDVRLMENRRSTVNIVDFAAKLISFNEDRIDKKPVSTNGFGRHVEVEKCRTKDEEQEYIIRNVEALIKEDGRSANEIAILAPTNAELVEYADLLQKRGIESVSINPEPILENPRVLGAIGLVKFMLSSSELNGTMYINARDKGKAMTMTEDEIRKSMLELQNEVKEIYDVSMLFEKFKALDPDENDEIYQSFLEDINTAKEEAVRKENLPEVCEYIIDFDRFGQKQTARKEKAYNGVVLSTMHSSKGKEWPVVFCSVTKMHGRDLKPEDIPEKNRLLFVACTRAKEELYISGVTIAVSTAAEDVKNLFLDECLQVAGEMYGDEGEEFAS